MKYVGARKLAQQIGVPRRVVHAEAAYRARRPERRAHAGRGGGIESAQTLLALRFDAPRGAVEENLD